MRQAVHDERIYVRLNRALLKPAEAKARRTGMSVSELTRAALRREVLEAA